MIKEKIDEHTRKAIREKLGISKKTLYNWENDLHTENYYKYLELLEILNINAHEHLKEYKNKKANRI